MSKLYAFRATEKETAQIEVLKKEGIGASDIFRAGLTYYLNNLKPQVIKTKEEAAEAIEKVKETHPEKNQFNTYGCGCEKAPGGIICSKHKRV